MHIYPSGQANKTIEREREMNVDFTWHRHKFIGFNL